MAAELGSLDAMAAYYDSLKMTLRPEPVRDSCLAEFIKDLSTLQYISCNIYEAGCCVKRYLKHTSPLSARVRFMAAT
jgi:hypothetical protein